MNLTIAKSAGFCFGVKRAVNMVYQAITDENTMLNDMQPEMTM